MNQQILSPGSGDTAGVWLEADLPSATFFRKAACPVNQLIKGSQISTERHFPPAWCSYVLSPVQMGCDKIKWLCCHQSQRSSMHYKLPCPQSDRHHASLKNTSKCLSVMCFLGFNLSLHSSSCHAFVYFLSVQQK